MLYDNVQTVSDSLQYCSEYKKSRRGKIRRLGIRKASTSQDLRVIYTKQQKLITTAEQKLSPAEL